MALKAPETAHANANADIRHALGSRKEKEARRAVTLPLQSHQSLECLESRSSRLSSRVQWSHSSR